MDHATALGLELPKLPELNRQDIAAVRNFFPGKLLSRTAALLAVALLVMAYTVGVDRALKSLDVDLGPAPWLHFTLFPGLPLLAVACQLLIEWRAKRNVRELKALAVRVGAEQSGYFRIGPYTADDQTRFSRADGAHEEVLNWIERSASVPLYLTGDSGSGKSSLLNAFVLPVLRERGWIVALARAGQEPEDALRLALGRQSATTRHRHGTDPPLRSLIETATRRTEARLLLVLDQFEEFVILGKPERRREFAALVADLQVHPVKGLSLLLVLRSDYQPFLEDTGLPPLRHGENFRQIGRFRFAAANDFLVHSGLKLHAAAIDRLLTSAAELDETPNLVRPITLNVIGYVLATGKPVAPSLDAGQLVRQYIEQTVGQPAIRDFAERVLEQLVTEQATKRPRSEQELVASTHLRLGEVRAVLNGLGAAALARPLDPALCVWELSHDFVARAIARHLGFRRRHMWRCGAFYVAPLLLISMLLAVTSMISEDLWSQRQVHLQLARLGLSVIELPDGVAGIVDPKQFTDENGAEAGRLLAKLPGLVVLDLSGTNVRNLEPIRPLSTLRALNLGGTAVTDIKPLARLTALRSLNLNDTKIKDLQPLAGLTLLEVLDLVGTPVENLEPLKNLHALHSLNLNGTGVRSLGTLKGLIGLQALYLDGTKVEDVKPLAGLTSLRRLDLSGTIVESIEAVKELGALLHLDLSETSVSELAPLGKLRSIRWLNLSGTKADNLEPLAGLITLQSLDLSNTGVEDLKPLGGLIALRSLNISGTTVEDLKPLAGLALQSLLLVGTTVCELEPLKRLHALQVLNLNGSRVSSLDPLKRLPALQVLYLSPTVSEVERAIFNHGRQKRNLQAVEIRH